MVQAENRKCTPGVYIAKGSKGIRIGQSVCPQTRVPRMAKKFEKCIGEIEQVVIIPVANKRQRLKLEKSLIEILGPRCNPIKR